MAKGFPCPNPACRYLFPPPAWPGVMTVTCPRCGRVFPVHAERAAPGAVPSTTDPRPAAQTEGRPNRPPGSPPPGDVPPALPPVTPVADPVPPPAASVPANVEPPSGLVPQPDVAPGTMRTRRRRSRSWGKGLALSVFLVAAALAFVAAWRWFGEPAGGDAPAGSAVEFAPLQCRYLKPNPPWEADRTGIKYNLKALLVMRRTAPSAWLALMAKDYKDHPPRDSDVREEAVRRMGGYFHPENLEWQPGADAWLAGRRAQRLVFRGEVDSTPMSGECYCLVHRGIAYWFLIWSPADQVASAQEEFEDLRRRFTLLDHRKDRAERRPATRTFRGHKIPYTLQDGENLWQAWTPATDYDRNADLALVARERADPAEGEGPKTAVAATVVVLALRGRQETLQAAVSAAQANLEAGQKVVYPETTIETVAEKVGASEPSDRIGNVAGRVVRLHVINGETRHRFLLLGVVCLPDHVLVLQCESAWQRRATWEPLFRQLLSTLRLASAQGSKVGDQGELSPEP